LGAPPQADQRFNAYYTGKRMPALHLRGIVLPGDLERDVFVVDGRITFAPVADAETVFTAGWLLPGLVDAHAHLALASPAPESATMQERVRASARAQLDAGVLAIREPGGPDRSSIGLGPHEGLPRVVAAGRFLAPPGGYFPGLAREVIESELRNAVVEEGRASGAWVKLVGDFFDADGRITPNWAVAGMTEAVQAAHAIGVRLAIHATCEATLDAAIEAGVDSIEHGVGLREDHLAAMAERGIALVPTLIILPGVEQLLAHMGSAATTAETLRMLRRHPETVRRASEAGVLVLAGTDAGMGPHGEVPKEMRLLLDAGLPLETALAAASWAARRYLGLSGIEEGAPADLVAYPDDPRGVLEVLDRPMLRILDGRVVSGA
jgi:imidazolonepropionase-like amidohydrolase